jgi:glycosyltransferase involved in cell wall biosynthesis
VLLDAFGKARETQPGLQLTLVGDGDDRAHLERLAAPFGEAVQFAGYQSQAGVADALASADIFVLPSFAEGLPVVLMEAMASGKPVISSLVAGIPELVEDGVNGYLVPPGDAETLAARIAELATDPGRRAEMGARGREKVSRDFDAGTEAARIARLFLEGPGAEVRPVPMKGTC